MKVLDSTQIERLRENARQKFAHIGLPNTKDEEWRFTSVREIAETEFAVGEYEKVSLGDISYIAAPRIVFVNGVYSEELSEFGGLPKGVIVKRLLDSNANVGALSGPDDSGFALQNAAAFCDGYYIYVPSGTILKDPIHVVFVVIARSQPIRADVRGLLEIDKNAQASVVETHLCLGDKSFLNSVTEAFIGENAILRHAKVQLGSERSFHIAQQLWSLERNSNAKTTTVTLGGRLVRNDTNAVLNGDGCECTINGLYIGRGEQHIDNHTKLDHAKPHCPSHELFKGILDDRSSAVFNGKIVVRPDAQKTDSKQSNMNLLLSDNATVNTKPQLEIFADDVRCTHGATIGRLDEDAMFYLRSRGIPEREARNLLFYAFASEVIERCDIPELVESLETMLFERFAEEQ